MGVYRGIYNFLIFASKHRLWVHVRTNVLSKNMKIVKKKSTENVIFTAVKNHCMLHGRVFIMRATQENAKRKAKTLIRPD